MRFAVLHAHPQPECLNVTLLNRVVAALESTGCDVTVTRLAQGEWIDAAGLAGVEGLVFVYPTWWGGLPAPMLHWVQRELADWIDGPSRGDSSPLRTVRRLAAVTTHGSTRWVNRLQGEPGLQLLKRSVVRLCARGTKLRWIACYGVDQRSDVEIATFVERAAERVAALAS